MARQSNTRLLTTGLNEYVKQKIFYDVNGRMTAVYETSTDAEHGAPALLTTFSYTGGSNDVDFMKEQEATWDGSWG